MMTHRAKGGRVLVVDDETYLREVIAFDLEREGYEVLQADCGQTAMAVVRDESVDLVVSDVRMPKGTGVDLLNWLKTWNPVGPAFIYMTAFSDLSADEAMDQGAEAFLTKPVANEDLLETVAKALVRRTDRWRVAEDPDRLRSLSLVDDPRFGLDQQRPRVIFGSGGAFVEMDSGLPRSLEILAFRIPFAPTPNISPDGAVLEGQARIRWVRHEAIGNLPPGIGLEFLYLADDSRQRFLDHLQTFKPRAYVPLGSMDT